MFLACVPAQDTRQRPRLLGIESGATHTAVLLADDAGEVLARSDLGPANLRLISESDLRGLLQEAKLRTGEADAIGCGIAGLRNEIDRARVVRAASDVWPRVPFRASDDLESALLAAGPLPKDTKARVLLLSGTGSCALGRSRTGRTVKFGGRGHILGDQGSASDIALTALRRIVYEHDVQRKFPALGEAVLRAAQLNDPDDLIPWTMEAGKDELARLAIIIFEKAAAGDWLARSVTSGAATKLADMALGCASHLLRKRGHVQFVFSGSVLLKQPSFAATVTRRIANAWHDAEVIRIPRESVWGAVEMARTALADAAHAKPARRAPARDWKRVAGGSPVSVESLAHSPTEKRNPRSMKLDTMPLTSAVELMLGEDATVPGAVLRARSGIVWLIRKVIAAFESGGRLFYVGAGTSGRLGVLDASECPPTFRASPEQVQGIIAGGRRALWSAVEGAEDDAQAGSLAVRSRGVRAGDVVLGIAASGRTPFVWGALHEAKALGASTALLCFNPKLRVKRTEQPDRMILIDAGPEVLTGSTRLKAGTATKLVLNIISTLAMVHTGKVVSNLMVDLNPSNTKLRDRAVRLVCELTGTDRTTAASALEQAAWSVKGAVAAVKHG